MLEMGEISGHTDVQCVLGCMYAFGEGVPVDNEKAFMYWKRAAMQVPLVGWLCWPAVSQPSSVSSLTLLPPHILIISRDLRIMARRRSM